MDMRFELERAQAHGMGESTALLSQRRGTIFDIIFEDGLEVSFDIDEIPYLEISNGHKNRIYELLQYLKEKGTFY